MVRAAAGNDRVRQDLTISWNHHSPVWGQRQYGHRACGFICLIGGGEYLQWNVDTQTITEIARQPAGRHTSTAEELQEAQPGEIVEFSVDPTRGSLLALLIQAATLGDIGPLGGLSECYMPIL